MTPRDPQRRELELAHRPVVTPDDIHLLARLSTAVQRKATRGQYARLLLPKVGCAVTSNNMLVMMAWMQAEGDAGRFNPLNTTWHLSGSTRFNSADVQNYPTLAEGVKATALTLNYGAAHDEHGYRLIRHALFINAHPDVALGAIEASAWGTGGLALKVYEETANDLLLGYKHHRIAQ